MAVYTLQTDLHRGGGARMAKHQKKQKKMPGGSEIEAAFQAFPPLGSAEYVAYVRSTPSAEMPAEALVRALRQLSPESEAWDVTLGRLFGRTGNRWDYLEPAASYVRARSQREHLGTHEDLLQDGLRRILELLPTDRGVAAEQAWHTFCRWEISEAWRERYGRRGERIPREEQPDDREDNQGGPDALLLLASETPPWHSIRLEDTQVTRIEEIALEVVEQIPDTFMRQLAGAAWFNGDRRAVSGRARRDSEPPLTELFATKSRFQIKRALRHINAQLAAALLACDDLVWTPGAHALLERLRGNRTPIEARVRER